MRVLLLVSAFNGLSQRAWCALRETGHDVGVLLASSATDMVDGVLAARPDLILCPFLKERVPAQVWQRWRTVIIHPGPVGDRGPSSLDWAVAEGAMRWGVTALQAVAELDGGPVWATRTFTIPAASPRKSALYNGPIADAAMACIAEVLDKAEDPFFVPVPAQRMRATVAGARLRRGIRQADRAFDWTDSSENIIRKIRAADGAPGVRTEVAGLPVFAYDVHRGVASPGRPGTVISRRQGAVLVGTGDDSVWLGHLRVAPAEPDGDASDASSAAQRPRSVKLPATTLLGRRLRGVPHSPVPPGVEPEAPSYRQVRYRRSGAVGWLAFDFYNGAMSTGHCRRLLAALRHAAAQDTTVLVLRSGLDAFSNGIHLHVVDAATDPAQAAWANIRAMNEVCREIIECTRQVVVAAYTGSAGAGGAMLGLGADVVAARSEVVFNPYYDIGLSGSELHTYTLPRRVGAAQAERLLAERYPVNAEQAQRLGLVDDVGPRHPDAFAEWLAGCAERLADPRAARARRTAKAKRLAAERVPLDAYEARELSEMSRDMFDDRSGFAAARRDFVHKVRPTSTPARLAFAGADPVRQVHITRPRSGTGVATSHVIRPAVPV